MPQRLTALEVSLLALDTAHTPSHVGTVDIFDPGSESFDYERLIGLIRTASRTCPDTGSGSVGARGWPVRSGSTTRTSTSPSTSAARPAPAGTAEQLREFVGRILARRLDRSRPLWEVYLVEGLADHQFALVSKTHLAAGAGSARWTSARCSWTPHPRPPARSTAAGCLATGTGTVGGGPAARGGLEDAQDPRSRWTTCAGR